MLHKFLFEASVWILPVVFAITMHEAAHGLVAFLCGDPTAKQLGRVTINPLPHVDKFGTIILPIICIVLAFGFVFGYAKPVPVDLNRLKRPRRDMIMVALAGPGANIVLAFFSACLLNLSSIMSFWLEEWVTATLYRMVFLNVVLAVFNLIPIPPLDGGRVLTGLLPYKIAAQYAKLERYGIFIILVLFIIVPAILGFLNFNSGFMQSWFSSVIFSLMKMILLFVGGH